MTDIDPRMLFVIRALHSVGECQGAMETEEVIGLQMVLESIVIDWRCGNDRLQRS